MLRLATLASRSTPERGRPLGVIPGVAADAAWVGSDAVLERAPADAHINLFAMHREPRGAMADLITGACRISWAAGRTLHGTALDRNTAHAGTPLCPPLCAHPASNAPDVSRQQPTSLSNAPVMWPGPRSQPKQKILHRKDLTASPARSGSFSARICTKHCRAPLAISQPASLKVLLALGRKGIGYYEVGGARPVLFAKDLWSTVCTLLKRGVTARHRVWIELQVAGGTQDREPARSCQWRSSAR